MCEEMIENIIAEVEKHRLLYDHTQPDYKDNGKKMLAWQEIATKIGAKSAQFVAMKWRGLRDTYSKYRKSILYPVYDEHDRRVGLCKWRWGPLMSFIDPYMRTPVDPRGRIQKKSPGHSYENSFESADRIILESESESSKEESPERYVSESIHSPVTSTSKRKTNIDNTTSKKQKFLEAIDEVPLELYHIEQQPIPSNVKLDMTDYLFLNYAETFKKMNRRNQALLKLKMAKMFAEAELEELDADPIKCKEISQKYFISE